MLEGAHGAVAALLTAIREAGHLPSDVGAGEGAHVAGRALPVQTSSWAACLWGNTCIRAQLWPALPAVLTSTSAPPPVYSPLRAPSHGSPVVPTPSSLGCAPQDQCHTLLQAPLPESGYFLLRLPTTGPGRGQPTGMG